MGRKPNVVMGANAALAGVDAPGTYAASDAGKRRLRELAQSLDCLTEDDLEVLSGCTSGTVKAQRKRGEGPAYILFGNVYLYPRLKLAEYLHTRLRDRRPADGKAVL